MKKYRGIVEVKIPIYCDAENKLDAYEKFNDNLYDYIQDTIGDADYYIWNHAYLNQIYSEGEGEVEEKSKRSLTERGIDAAVRFLERREYEILDVHYSDKSNFNIICRNETGGLVFADVYVNNKTMPAEQEQSFDREQAERKAFNWLSNNLKTIENDEFGFRFDEIVVTVLAEDKAILRHHINVGSDA